MLAGEHKWEFAASSKQIAALGLAERVLCPGAIADEDLPALYQGAIALVHPSRYEGFGLQAGGSDGFGNSSAGFAKLPACQRCSAAAVCCLIRKIRLPSPPRWSASRRDRNLRTRLMERGRERARFFSWRKAAEETLGLYLGLLGRGDEIARFCGRKERSSRGENRRGDSGCRLILSAIPRRDGSTY